MEAPASEIFVGRGRELGQLERTLDAARQGSGTTALVSGEAGIGKTRLASVLAARARDAGFEVLLGRSIDLVGAELPYQPFVEALRPLGAFPQAEGQAAGPQLRVFQETMALLFGRAAATLCWSSSRTCTGPTPRRSTWSSSWPTTSRTGGSCCWRPTAPTSSPRPSACAGLPTGSVARDRRSSLSSAGSSARN
jgi:hypothetical protein